VTYNVDVVFVNNYDVTTSFCGLCTFSHFSRCVHINDTIYIRRIYAWLLNVGTGFNCK
jgi:hypothetical protein